MACTYVGAAANVASDAGSVTLASFTASDVVIVFVKLYDAAKTVSGVTFNGSATGWSKIGNTSTAPTANWAVETWQGKGLSGAYNLVVSVTGGYATRIQASAIAISGCDTTTPVTTANMGGSVVETGYPASVSDAVTLGANGIVVDVLATNMNGTPFTPGASQTDIAAATLDDGTGTIGRMQCSYKTANGTMAWTFDQSPSELHVVVPVNAPAAGAFSLLEYGIG